ncbi:hypothetical protein NQZ68_009283 [Dissostichus eleginoides]|nr:hypothetical protein NQZ68_009283 [Dissostichus eleginoides]
MVLVAVHRGGPANSSDNEVRPKTLLKTKWGDDDGSGDDGRMKRRGEEHMTSCEGCFHLWRSEGKQQCCLSWTTRGQNLVRNYNGDSLKRHPSKAVNREEKQLKVGDRKGMEEEEERDRKKRKRQRFLLPQLGVLFSDAAARRSLWPFHFYASVVLGQIAAAMLGKEKHRPGFSSFQTQSLRHLSWRVREPRDEPRQRGRVHQFISRRPMRSSNEEAGWHPSSYEVTSGLLQGSHHDSQDHCSGPRLLNVLQTLNTLQGTRAVFTDRPVWLIAKSSSQTEVVTSLHISACLGTGACRVRIVFSEGLLSERHNLQREKLGLMSFITFSFVDQLRPQKLITTEEPLSASLTKPTVTDSTETVFRPGAASHTINAQLQFTSCLQLPSNPQLKGGGEGRESEQAV